MFLIYKTCSGLQAFASRNGAVSGKPFYLHYIFFADLADHDHGARRMEYGGVDPFHTLDGRLQKFRVLNPCERDFIPFVEKYALFYDNRVLFQNKKAFAVKPWEIDKQQKKIRKQK